jgi:hypothetical protein
MVRLVDDSHAAFTDPVEDPATADEGELEIRIVRHKASVWADEKNLPSMFPLLRHVLRRWSLPLVKGRTQHVMGERVG